MSQPVDESAELVRVDDELASITKQIRSVEANSHAVDAAIAGRGTYRGYSGEDCFLKDNLRVVQREIMNQLHREERALNSRKRQLLAHGAQCAHVGATSSVVTSGSSKPRSEDASSSPTSTDASTRFCRQKQSIEAQKTEMAAGPSASGPVLREKLTSTSAPERITDSASTTADGTSSTPGPSPKRPSPDSADSSLHEHRPREARAQATSVAPPGKKQNASTADEGVNANYATSVATSGQDQKGPTVDDVKNGAEAPSVASSGQERHAPTADEGVNGADATSVATSGQEPKGSTVDDAKNGAEAPSVASSGQEQHAPTADEGVNGADATSVAASGQEQKGPTVDDVKNGAEVPSVYCSGQEQHAPTADDGVNGADATSVAASGQEQKGSTVDDVKNGGGVPSIAPSGQEQNASTADEREPGANAPSVYCSGQEQNGSTADEREPGAEAPSIAPSGQEQEASKSDEGKRGAHTPNVNAKDESRVPKPSPGSSSDAGAGSKRKRSSKRDFSRLPRVSKTPKRGQTDTPGPARSVEEYLANIGKGMEAVASIEPETVFWIKFSDTVEAWLECGVVTKVHSRSAKPYEVDWRPYDSSGMDLADNPQQRIALLPRLFVSFPETPPFVSAAGIDREPPAGSAGKGFFTPASKTMTLNVPPIGSWSIVRPDQPWGDLEPFAF